MVASSGRREANICRRLVQASIAFRALHKVVFGEKDLKVKKSMQNTKPVSSWSCCTAQCWTALRRHLKRLNSFHYRPQMYPQHLGISRRQQWTQQTTSTKLRPRGNRGCLVHRSHDIKSSMSYTLQRDVMEETTIDDHHRMVGTEQPAC